MCVALDLAQALGDVDEHDEETIIVTISRRGTSVVLANMLLNTGTMTMIGIAFTAIGERRDQLVDHPEAACSRKLSGDADDDAEHEADERVLAR